MSPPSKKLSFTLIIVLFSISAITYAKSIRGPTSVKCTERSDMCTREYNPVCAYKPNIVCVTTPCNYITYSNPCEACGDSDVESYTFGACENPHPTQVSIVPVKQASEETNTAFVSSIEVENELRIAPQPIVTKCSPESREGDICPAVYMPVCAYKPDIVCVTTPCNYITYGSPCEACHDPDVESYTYGECPEEEKPVIIECFMPEPKGIMECSPDSRDGEICPAVYMPVCAYKPDIVCITTPCNYITYGSPCEACHDKDVASYTYGECPEEEPKPKPVPKVTKCTPESREIDGCYEIYKPVCGYLPDIVCVTTPCNYITYGNACEACSNPLVESYTEGECADEAKNH